MPWAKKGKKWRINKYQETERSYRVSTFQIAIPDRDWICLFDLATFVKRGGPKTLIPRDISSSGWRIGGDRIFWRKKIPRQLSARSSLVTCVARRSHLSLFTLRTRCPRKCPRVYLLRSRSHKSRRCTSACPRTRELYRAFRDYPRVGIFKRNYDKRPPGNPAETRIAARLTATNARQARSLKSRPRVSLWVRYYNLKHDSWSHPTCLGWNDDIIVWVPASSKDLRIRKIYHLC